MTVTVAEMEALARSQPNPFSGSVLRNGFEQPQNDVPEIHAEPRRRLRGLIEEVRRTGDLRLQVITGQPGDGKTHLLASLRAEAEGSWLHPGTERVMVPIEPLRIPDAPFGHILRQVHLGLTRPFAAMPFDSATPITPLEHILWRILRRVTSKLAAVGEPICSEVSAQLTRDDLTRYPGFATMLLREHWAALEPVLLREAPRLAEFSPERVDPEVWRVLCRFPREPLTMRWLAGYSLADADLNTLGVTAPLDGEERAYRGLSTLLHLTDVPIVLGFDQLEGVARLGEDAVGNFLQDLGDRLYSGGGRALVLLFCQADAWKQFAGRLQSQTRDRLEERPILNLPFLSPELGERLVERRLAAMWAGLSVVPPYATFPYPEGFVRKTIREAASTLRGPRGVLTCFARLGFGDFQPSVEPEPKSPREVARAEYGRIRQELAQEPEPSPEEAAAITQSALTQILSRAGTLDGRRIVRAGLISLDKKGITGLSAKVAGEGTEASVYAEASNSQNGMAGKAVVKRLKDALSSKKADRALLLRSDKIPLPPGTAKAFTDLGDRAAIVRVGDDDTLSFAAVERLLNQAAAKDIEVAPEDAADFVLADIAPSLAVVRAFLDAALKTGGPAAPAVHESVVLSAISRAPYVASEAQLARAHGLEPEQIARTSDELERQGQAVVVRGKDGDRTVMRTPR